MGGALRGSLWTAVIWTAPETRTQGLPLAPQPPNPLNLCPTLMTGKVHLHICSMVNLCLFLPDFSVVVVCYFHIHRCFYLFFFVIYDKLQWPGSNPPYDAELMFFLLFFAASALRSSFLLRALQHPVRHQLLKTRACPSLSLAQVSNFCS